MEQTEPGTMMAQVEISAASYTDMVEQATTLFNQLFEGRNWTWLGARIVPGEEATSFGGGYDVLTWDGTFFAAVFENQ